MFYVDADKCQGCGACVPACPAGAISLLGSVASVDAGRCNGCGRCLEVCPQQAIIAVEAPVPAVRVEIPPSAVAAPSPSLASRALAGLAPRLLEMGFWLLDNWLERRLGQPPAPIGVPQRPIEPSHVPGQMGRQRRQRRRGLF